MPDQWTIGRLLNWTADFLKSKGSESPRLEAEVLLAFARGCKRIELYTSFDEPADEALRERFRELVRRCGEGTPVAYLVGKKEFYSLPFKVTPDVLIPRPETELLVVRLLDLAKGVAAATPLSIADVGVGSGIIAICAAKYLPHAHVTAMDTSPAALAVAKENAATHGVLDRIEWIESDLLSAVASERRFDIIASNPPYVSQAEFDKLPPTVKNFEPRQALLAGPKGTEIVERLAAEAAPRLSAGGWLLIEISPMIAAAAKQILEQNALLETAPTIKDLAGQERIVQARRK